MAKATINTASNEVKEKALGGLLASINKKFGDGTAVTFNEKPQQIPRISSGSLRLDYIIGGGFPKGRVIEVYGPESSGKTTISTLAIAQAQKQGLTCAFVDAEQSLIPEYVQSLGVDLSKLILIQPNSGEDALEAAEMLVSSGAIDLVVVDSVAALVPRAELDGEMGDASIGLQARLMSKAMRKLTSPLSKTGTTIIFINQLREKIGVMFGNPETTTGGRALKFYASIRIDVRKGDAITGDGGPKDFIGHYLKLKTVKNKTSAPYKETKAPLIYGEGYDYITEVIEEGVAAGIIEKAGSWYKYNKEQLGQGVQGAKANLKDNLPLFTEIEAKVKDAMGFGEVDEINDDAS